MSLARIIAIGSPHGDDQVAWRLIERLRIPPASHAETVALSDPLHLYDYLENCDRLIVVDACAGGGSSGWITRMEWPDARVERRHAHSTHGISVVDALRLAETLGRFPPQVVLFGVELRQCQPLHPLSDDVEYALNELEKRILLEIQ